MKSGRGAATNSPANGHFFFCHERATYFRQKDVDWNDARHAAIQAVILRSARIG